MSQTLRNAIITESDNKEKYIPTLLGVYDRMDEKGFLKKPNLQNVPLIL